MAIESDDSMDFLNLNPGSVQLTEEQIIEFNKYHFKLCKNAEKRSKSDRCFVCNRKVSSFCKSHFVPLFCLKNLGGMLFLFNSIIGMPGSKEEIGKNDAGVFYLICRDCDNRIFKKYETPENYVHKPSIEMLSQIAMKTYLKKISLRKTEKCLYDILSENGINFAINQNAIHALDLNFYIREYNHARDISHAPRGCDYIFFYYKKLNYTTPIAFQDSFALPSDLEGNIINDIFNMNPQYKNEEIHICVFPIGHETVVMMFSDILNIKYTKFYHQFNNLSDDDKLLLINYYIFKYSEHVFISKHIDESALKSENMKRISSDTNIAMVQRPDMNPIHEVIRKFNICEIYTIPNFLDKKYAVCQPSKQLPPENQKN